MLTNIMSSHNYAAEWVSAIERTKRFHLKIPSHQMEIEKLFLTADRQAEFPHIIQQELGNVAPSDIVAQCLSISYRLAPILQKWLACPVLYTLGWIDDGTDKAIFKFDDAFIAEMLKCGHAGGSVNIHAWLTLPSMEVIDVALPTTISVLQNIPEVYGRAIAQPADKLKGMAYKPMLVGSDFLFKAGLFKIFIEAM